MTLPIYPFTDVKPSFKSDPEDVVIRSSPDAGKIITRKKFTKARSTLSGVIFELNESILGEKTIADEFYTNEVGEGSLPFTLSLRLDGIMISYTPVLFLSPPKYTYVGMGCWDLEISVMEVIKV